MACAANAMQAFYNTFFLYQLLRGFYNFPLSKSEANKKLQNEEYGDRFTFDHEKEEEEE